MMPAGRGTPRDVAERNQRERLFAAMVATVARKGYEATRVADLSDLSGVSRSSFYQHFQDKEACFLAMVEALVEPVTERLNGGLEREDAEAIREAFEELIGALVEQPVAARVVFDVYAAGPEGVALAERVLEGFEVVLERLLDSARGGEDMPTEVIRALIGGVQKVIRQRLNSGQEEVLVELAPLLWDWMMGYPPPPGPLRAPQARSLEPRPFEERQAASSPVERVLRAMAAVISEQGYLETSVAEIVQRARTSQRTFYENFGNREEAVIAALDNASSKMEAAARSAFDWQHRVVAAEEAMFHFSVAEPEFARLNGTDMYAAGKRALEHREAVGRTIEGLLEPGYELAPETPAVAGEAIGGAIYALLYDIDVPRVPGRLAELVRMSSYISLVPFLGAEEAYAVTVGNGRIEPVETSNAALASVGSDANGGG
jgi:AcrR family transcriptional regulator